MIAIVVVGCLLCVAAGLFIGYAIWGADDGSKP